MKTKKIKVGLPVIYYREGKYYIAQCPVLDLVSQGKTYEEAGKRFEELVKIFFEECNKMGTLNKMRVRGPTGMIQGPL
jgi:predicted RNase H-like HicB family nuclease